MIVHWEFRKLSWLMMDDVHMNTQGLPDLAISPPFICSQGDIRVGCALSFIY